MPFTGVNAPAEAFAPPIFADYEMSEIILKACNPNPEDRWQDPEEFRNALVSYMQRNGANDTPIVPPQIEIQDESFEEDAELDSQEEMNAVVDGDSGEVEEAYEETVEALEIDAVASTNESEDTNAEDDDLLSLEFLKEEQLVLILHHHS